VDDAEKASRIERRREVVHLIKAMHDNDQLTIDNLMGKLVADEDRQKVIGALAVAGSTLAGSLAKAAKRPIDDVFDELEKGLTEAPVED
jgi:cystathionine beta-lyase family protein involved in aluminum resistance